MLSKNKLSKCAEQNMLSPHRETALFLLWHKKASFFDLSDSSDAFKRSDLFQ